MKTHESHILYTKDDFTKEEIKNKNPIAMFVLKSKLKICKQCGAAGKKELAQKCGRAIRYKEQINNRGVIMIR